jgi:hypothetical protein
MPCRWVVLLAGLTALAVLAGGVLFALRDRVHIDPETCAKIKPGMSLEEVKAILGGHPGFYGIEGAGSEAPPMKECWHWVSQEWDIQVVMDDHNKVKSAKCYRAWPISPR